MVLFIFRKDLGGLPVIVLARPCPQVSELGSTERSSRDRSGTDDQYDILSRKWAE